MPATTKQVLGIDIGTSSVKCSLVQIDPHSRTQFHILAQCKQSYNVDRIKSHQQLPPSYSQQNVDEIIATIRTTLAGLDLSTTVDLITVCGQMHGVVLWNRESTTTSDHYDWTDCRCDGTFLASLPTPDCFADRLNSGYGCVTLFWLTRNQPGLMQQYQHSGTIMDYFTFNLCNLDRAQMSSQNANNWGYFDPESNEWNWDL